MTKREDTVKVLKTATCKKLSDKSTLTYRASSALHINALFQPEPLAADSPI